MERFKAQLELQRKKLRDTSVRAPFNGSVKERSVNVGQFVRVNSPLFTLVKTDPLRLKLEVPERMAPWIKNGQIVQVELEAFEGKQFQGTIWRISPTFVARLRRWRSAVRLHWEMSTGRRASWRRSIGSGRRRPQMRIRCADGP